MGHGHGGKGDAGGKGAAAILTPVALTTGADSVGTNGNDWITATAATLSFWPRRSQGKCTLMRPC